jgi:hypothetical protein
MIMARTLSITLFDAGSGEHPAPAAIQPDQALQHFIAPAREVCSGHGQRRKRRRPAKRPAFYRSVRDGT